MSFMESVDYVLENMIKYAFFKKNGSEHSSFSLLYPDIECINISELKRIRSLGNGTSYDVTCVEYNGKEYAFKQIQKDEFIEENAVHHIFCSILGLQKGKDIFPELFPDVKGFVVSDKHSELTRDNLSYEGLLVEYFGNNYKLLSYYYDFLNDDTINQIEEVVRTMQNNWVWCDAKADNILIDANQNIKFIDSSFEQPLITDYKDEWHNIKKIKLKMTEFPSFMDIEKEWLKQIIQTYKTVLKCSFDDDTWWFKDIIDK